MSEWVVDAQNITKVYQMGEFEVHALRGVSVQDCPLRSGLDHGAVRLGQIDPDEHAGLPGPAHQRASTSWMAKRSRT